MPHDNGSREKVVGKIESKRKMIVVDSDECGSMAGAACCRRKETELNLCSRQAL